MELVLLTAVTVGGATILGAVIGFVFNGGVDERWGNIILSFAAGIMLASSVLGLILPSLSYGTKYAFLVSVLGIFGGAFLIFSLDKLSVNSDLSVSQATVEKKQEKNSLKLFAVAIAIHNFPEGLAAGVGFGAGNTADALMIAGGIALQNIPEGMVIISPMIESGIKKGRAFLYAALTGVIEIVGTLLGYFAITVSYSVLPFILSFAGGTMLYVISDDIIPATHTDRTERSATFALLLGFCFMLAADYFLG